MAQLHNMADATERTERGWFPSREDVLRGHDRLLVQQARGGGHALQLLLLLVGPGILVMLGENDGPSMLSYAVTGAAYGIGFFVPFILLTFVMAFVVQEMTVRLGAATHRGHAAMIFERFGPFWGYFAMFDLVVGNILTLITEFIAIRAGAAYFGVPAWMSVGVGIIIVVLTLSTRRYFTWERTVLLVALANLVFVPTALLSHPDYHALRSALITWGPLPGGPNFAFLTLVMANIGATVTPWMLFFQQSATVDKGMTRGDIAHGRIDTALGALLAALAAVGCLTTCAVLFQHHISASQLSGGADFASALRPFIGSVGASLFAIGMVEAGLVAAVTISTSSAYAFGEVFHRGHSLNLDFGEGPLFYVTAVASVLLSGLVVLIPHAPLLAITITVNVIATMLMAPALLLLLLLSNDREVMGGLANTRAQNVLAGAIVIGITLVGAFYGLVTVFPNLLRA
jgi:Mn2+/Fe2+ NRAMP family transporter